MKTFYAVIFGIGVFTVLNLIPVLNILSLPIAMLAGLGAGIYLMSQN